jgi:hypothetical protein
MRIILHNRHRASHLLRRACAPRAGPARARGFASGKPTARHASLALGASPAASNGRLRQPTVQSLRRADGASRKSKPARRPLQAARQARQVCQTTRLARTARRGPLPHALPFDACRPIKSAPACTRSNVSNSRILPRKRNHRAISSLILACCNA